MNEQQLRQIIRLAVKQARNITNDTEALEVKYLYKEYDAQIGRDLTVGEYIQYNDKLYKVLQAHTVQSNWTPENAPSLFAEVLTDPTGETILEWKQPSSTNPYMKGDKVMFEGKTYESLIDNNVWSPAAYPAGWKNIG
jgi:hypothetical protein